MFLKLLLFISLIIVSIFSIDYKITYISDINTYMQSLYILPKQYDIIFTSYIKEDTFVGNYNISVQILRPFNRIKLYLDVKRVIDIIVIKDPKIFTEDADIMNVYKPVRALYDNEVNITEYIFQNNISPGNYTIKLIYNITDTGLKKFYKGNRRQWLAAYVDTIGIQHLISNLPESLNSPFYNIIIEHDQNYKALSNIPIKKIEMIDEYMRTHFNTFIMPNYLVFFRNLSRMSRTNERIQVDMWCRMHCEFVHEFVENITLYLFYKWKRLSETQINHVAIPDFRNNSIINLGLVIYGEADVIYIENVDSVASKIKIAYFIAYKVVQECFYYENPLWSSSSWLNEATVLFLGLYIMDKAFPNTRMADLFVVQFQHEYLHFDTEYNTLLYNRSFNNSFEHPRYIQGFSVLRMLQHMVSEKEFWENIRKYTRNNEPSYHFANIILNNNKFAKNYSMRQIINSWTKHKYCLVLKVTRNYNKTVEQINVTISHDLNKVADYDMPITYIMHKDHFFNPVLYITSLSYLLRRQLILPYEENWILFNIQQTGYYRVNYDIENWRRIASYLNSENYMTIHVLNRAQIIDDAFHLMITNQLNSTIFWNITKYLTRETNYIAWYPMFKALEYLSNIFLFRDTIYFHIKMKMRNLLQDLLDKLGYDEVSKEHDLQKFLRVEAAKWACNLDGRICIEAALHNLNRHLADSEKNTLLPWWEEWTYCQGLKILYYSLNNHEDSPWWRVYHLGKEKFKNKLLKYLACSENLQFVKDYLNLIKNDSTMSIMFLEDFSDQDYIDYFLFTIAKHARNPVVLDFILHNFITIKPKQISEYATFTVIINHMYSTEQLNKIYNLLIDKLIKLNTYNMAWISYKEGTETKIKTIGTEIAEDFRCLKQYIINIQSKILIRLFEIESQQNYFRNFLKNQ